MTFVVIETEDKVEVNDVVVLVYVVTPFGGGVIPMKETARAGGCCSLDIHCYTVLYQLKLLE